MAFHKLLSVSGPLPIKANFSVSADGPVDFFITSTAWTTTAGTWIGIAVAVNGVGIDNVNMFANFVQQHMTLPTLFLTANITDQTVQQTIVISPNTAQTVTDQNDVFTVWAQY
jgi:hypothetical protein